MGYVILSCDDFVLFGGWVGVLFWFDSGINFGYGWVMLLCWMGFGGVGDVVGVIGVF